MRISPRVSPRSSLRYFYFQINIFALTGYAHQTEQRKFQNQKSPLQGVPENMRHAGFFILYMRPFK